MLLGNGAGGNAVGLFWSNYSDLTRPGPPNGGLVGEFPLFQGNPGWRIIIIWLDCLCATLTIEVAGRNVLMQFFLEPEILAEE